MHSNILVKGARKGDEEWGKEVCPFDLRASPGFLPGCAAVFHPRQAFLSYLLSTDRHQIDIASMCRYLKLVFLVESLSVASYASSAIPFMYGRERSMLSERKVLRI